MKKTIIIMCKSIKHYPNYCIAGIDTTTKEWIRPISNNDDVEGAVLVKDATYQDGNEVEIFDIVEIEMIKACPTNAQKENYLYNDKVKWKKVGESSLQEVINFRGFDNYNYIFNNTNPSLIDNELDGTSLMLVQIQRPEICIKTFERKKIQLNFTYKNEDYKYIKIGDLSILNSYVNNSDGYYQLNQPTIAVFSLTGKYNYNEKYYKMLAQLF